MYICLLYSNDGCRVKEYYFIKEREKEKKKKREGQRGGPVGEKEKKKG